MVRDQDYGERSGITVRGQDYGERSRSWLEIKIMVRDQHHGERS